MKKLSELMKNMGFNSNSSDSVKEAFIKHLIKTSSGVNVMTPSERKIVNTNPSKIVSFPQQLAFEFDESATNDPQQIKKA